MKRKTDVKHYLWRLLAVVAIMVGGTAFAGNSGQADLRGTKLDLGVKQGTILEIMDKISKNTEYVFVYEDGIKKELNKKVTIENGKNLQEVLGDITRQSNLEFRAINNNIVVRTRTADQSAVGETMLQGRRVTGKVTSSEDNTGLPGVNIVQKGTTNGTVSDIDGNYSLDVPADDAVLVFSSVGFTSEEIAVGSRSVIDLAMSPDIQALNEVVVTALGIEREQRSLGYDVGKVEGKDLTVVPQDNVLNSLAGRVAGVTVNQTGAAGSTVSVVIRGANSLTSDNQPLFVIDGVPVSNSLNNIKVNGNDNQVDYGNTISDLNPDDIASMTVLKGPSAAALYGTRAGNGVVIITTKSGSGAKKLGVDVSSSTLFEWPTRLLDLHYKYANGGRQNELDETSAYWGGPALDAGVIEPQFGYPEGAELKSYPNNMKEFLQTGITSNNSVALSGGNENGNFRIAFNNMSMRGMIPEHDRFNNGLRTSLNYNLSKKLKFESNISIARTWSNNIPSTGDRNNNPLEAVYNSSYISMDLLKDYWLPGQEQIAQNRPPAGDNPYFLAKAIDNSFVRDRIFGNIGLNYDFTDDLSLRLRYNLDRYNEEFETKVPFSASRMARGNYTIENAFYQETNTEVLLSYKKQLSDFDLSFSVGGNWMNRNGNNNRTGSGGDRNNGLVIPGLYTVGNIPLTNISVSSSEYEKAIYSVFGLASIGFKNQLYLDLTARNDWSSTLPVEDNQNSYFYPSASLSWLANYTFDLPSNISLLKLRGGWAQVGNDTGPYRLQQTLGLGTWNTLTTESVPGTLLNPDLKPEMATSMEFGLDLNLFNDRVRFTGTYYTEDNENQIFSVPLPRSSGYSSKLINAGLINSSGWEFTFGGTPIQNGKITWDIDFNLTKNSTTVEELTDDLDRVIIWSENAGAISFIGDKIGDIYSYGIATVKDPNSEYYGWPIIDGTEWVRLNQVQDWEKVGNFNPDFLLGMQTALSFNKFRVSASFDWRQGGEFVSYTYRYGESDWKSQRQIDQLIPGGLMTTDELVAYLKSNPDEYIIPQVGKYPRVGGHTQETGGFEVDGVYDGAFIPGVVQTAGDDTPDDFTDDEYMEHLGGPGTQIIPITDTYPWSYNKNITFDASFIKLRELAVSYRLPKIAGISNANFGVFTRNLMLWNAAKIGIDSERAFQANGGTQGNTTSQFKQGFERQNVMPWSASFGFKLDFSF